MIRNNKKYKVFSVAEDDVVKEFVAYCKKNNKVMNKELVTAIKFYLNQKNNKNF